jgi:hypothetical protein
MEDQYNPEFVGDQTKFKYLAIHGYEDFQRDKQGQLPDGSRQWIKDATRKDSDEDYSKLRFFQRYVLDGLRRQTGLHGKWCPNDPTWVARALCADPKDRPHIPHAIRTLVARRLLILSNDKLGSLEAVDKKEKKERKHVPPDRQQKTETETAKPEAKTETAPAEVKGLCRKCRQWDRHASWCPVKDEKPAPVKVFKPTLLNVWDEDVTDRDGLIPAAYIRRALKHKRSSGNDFWEKRGPSYIREHARELVNEVPPAALQPTFEARPDPDCDACKGSGEVIEEDGLYQSSVTCECVKQVEVG